jgi:hypothetical protein
MKTHLYILLGVAAFLIVGELAMIVRSELLVHVAVCLGMSSLIPLWVETYNESLTS